jgi:hypothetical protein
MRLNLTMPLVTVPEGSKKPLMVGQKRSSGDSVRKAVWEIRVWLKLEYNDWGRVFVSVGESYW